MPGFPRPEENGAARLIHEPGGAASGSILKQREVICRSLSSVSVAEYRSHAQIGERGCTPDDLRAAYSGRAPDHLVRRGSRAPDDDVADRGSRSPDDDVIGERARAPEDLSAPDHLKVVDAGPPDDV